MTDDLNYDLLDKLIEQAFRGAFKKETKQQKKEETIIYESIEDYTAQTGKRFRMTKSQKELGMTRDEAFNETFGGTN